MKIKRSSWHYKISCFGSCWNKDDNLCIYFWRLVGKVMLVFFWVIIVCALIIVYFSIPQWILVTIVLIWLFSSIIIPYLTIHYLRDKVGKPIEIPGESIMVEYLKAKKRKICPLIEYID